MFKIFLFKKQNRLILSATACVNAIVIFNLKFVYAINPQDITVLEIFLPLTNLQYLIRLKNIKFVFNCNHSIFQSNLE